MSRRNGAKPDSQGDYLGHNRFAGFVRKIRLEPKMILAVNEEVCDKRTADELAAAIRETGVPNVILFVVKDVNQLKTFPEQDMNKLGWFHLASIKKTLLRRPGNATLEEVQTTDSAPGQDDGNAGVPGEPSEPIPPADRSAVDD